MEPAIKILENGLAKLWQQIQGQKAKLEAELKAGKPISNTDEEWLDGTGNLVDEEQVLNILAHASDYEQAFTSLNSHDKTIVKKLENLAGNGEPPSNKRKHMVFPDWSKPH